MSRRNPEELIGRTFGRQFVTAFAGRGKEGRAQYTCECSCGKQVTVTGKNLLSGNTRSCGCIRKNAANCKDMIGMRFGRLQVIDRAGTSHMRTATWKCICDCGNECVVSGSYLRQGDTKSCGCWQVEGASQRARKNIRGMKFSKLTVREEFLQGQKYPGQVLWICDCECGNTCIVPTESLTGGNTKSCGCLLSNGERILHELLRKYKIAYEYQKTFPGCRDRKALRFDFYIADKNLAIEYQGQQHYSPIALFGGVEGHEAQKRRDEIKRTFCAQNGIRLLEIPYYEKDSLEDILIRELQIDTESNRSQNEQSTI